MAKLWPVSTEVRSVKLLVGVVWQHAILPDGLKKLESQDAVPSHNEKQPRIYEGRELLQDSTHGLLSECHGP